VNQIGLNLGSELIIDLFAGGGGASCGIEQGIGRAVDIAVNHDPMAITMHEANHPGTHHFCESVFKVNPISVTDNQPVGLLWASPDCTHHSKAKGGKPVSAKRRGLAWVVIKWARRTRPRVIMLENVEEFEDWGPVIPKTGPTGEVLRFPDGKPMLVPCPARKGQEFQKFKAQLQRLGYQVEHRQLRACDYGAPTIRKRFFLIARRDGRPIVWPKPSHGPANSLPVRRGRQQPFRTAAECIDWSIPCPSIFDRKKPLAENTLRRIAKGIQRFVLDAAEPFVIAIDHGSARSGCVWPGSEPLTTITTENRHALVVPSITKFRTGAVGHGVDEPLHTVTANSFVKRPGGAAPFGLVTAHIQRDFWNSVGSPAGAPVGTVTAGGGGKAALVTAFMAKHYGGVVGTELRKPIGTITTIDHHSLVAAHMINLKGSDRRASAATDPAATICAGGTHAGLVAAFMAPYYGSGSGETGRDIRQPAPTCTTKDRLQLVTVSIDGETYVITDIGMRMLQPRELFKANGFPDDYIIDPIVNGKPLPKYAQVRMCGNSVPPVWPKALVRANFSHEKKLEATA
jgi:DNA (cytosine-5)-methyltransferase 1